MLSVLNTTLNKDYSILLYYILFYETTLKPINPSTKHDKKVMVNQFSYHKTTMKIY